MKINTAVCFVLTGISLFLLTLGRKRFRSLQLTISLIIALTGFISLAQDIFGFNSGIDELLFRDEATRLTGSGVPGRMAPATAFNFLLLGVSFCFVFNPDKRVRIAVQYALHVISLISFIAIVGYFYDVTSIKELYFLSSMALQTSALFFIIGFGASLFNPFLGLTGLFTGKTTGSIMARRLFPLTIFLVLTFGYLGMFVHRRRLIAEDFAFDLFTVFYLLVALLLISITARHLNTIDAKRKNAEDELVQLIKTEGEQTLRKAISVVGDNVWEHDFVAQKTFFSDMIHKLIGYRKDETSDNEKLWWNITFPDDRHLLDENNRKYKAGIIDRHSIEYRVICKDGTIKWILDRGVVTEKDNHGLPLRIVGTHTDITGRKRAEEKFRRLLESAPDAMVIVDEKGEIQLVNAQTESLFGYHRNDLIGKPVELLIPDRYHTRHAEQRNTFFSDAHTRNMGEGQYLFCKTQNGKEIPVEVSLSPLRTEDGLLVTAAIRDITERKTFEDELKKLNEQLRLSNLELEQFAYVASHDLQEPLRMVSSFMQLLEKKYKSVLDEKAQQYIHFAIDGAERMKELIHDLLAYSRIGMEQQFDQVVDLNKIIDELKLNTFSLIKESQATINCSRLPVVRANRMQMLQLFQNLVSNAIKYRGKAPPLVEISSSEEPDKYWFYVKDNGIGIDKKYFEKIFIIFQRLHDRAAYTGTGIGLSICKRIVEKHGGTILVESVPGNGSTFHFSLPKSKPQ